MTYFSREIPLLEFKFKVAFGKAGSTASALPLAHSHPVLR